MLNSLWKTSNKQASAEVAVPTVSAARSIINKLRKDFASAAIGHTPDNFDFNEAMAVVRLTNSPDVDLNNGEFISIAEIENDLIRHKHLSRVKSDASIDARRKLLVTGLETRLDAINEEWRSGMLPLTCRYIGKRIVGVRLMTASEFQSWETKKKKNIARAEEALQAKLNAIRLLPEDNSLRLAAFAGA
jgi:hypothetical protein